MTREDEFTKAIREFGQNQGADLSVFGQYVNTQFNLIQEIVREAKEEDDRDE